MDREEIREQFSPILDDELTPDERSAIEADLAQDAELLRELHSLKRVDELYRRMPPLHAPKDFEAGVRAKLRPGVLRFPAAVFTRRRVLGIAAAAAVVLLVAGVVVMQYSPAGERFEMAALKESAPQATSASAQAAPYRMSAQEESAPPADAAAPSAPQQQADTFGNFDYKESRGGSSASGRRSYFGTPVAAPVAAPAAAPAPASPSPASAAGAGGAMAGSSTLPELEQKTAKTSEQKGVAPSARKPDVDRGRETSAAEAPVVGRDRSTDAKDELSTLGYVGDTDKTKKDNQSTGGSKQERSEKAKSDYVAGNAVVSDEPAAAEPPKRQTLKLSIENAPGSAMIAPAPAPPALGAESPPPLVPYEYDVNGDGVEERVARHSQPQEKKDADISPSTEAAALPAASPPPAPAVRKSGQDGMKKIDSLQNVTVGGTFNEATTRFPKSTATPESTLPDTKRVLGERVFDLRDGIWRQAEYKDETIVLLDRTSDVAKQLIKKEPALKDVLDFDKPVIFGAQGHWYRVEPAKK